MNYLMMGTLLPSENPLHGVESHPSTIGRLRAMTLGIHYMELKVNTKLSPSKPPQNANPLHGVESEEEVADRLNLSLRIHYMELKVQHGVHVGVRTVIF